MNNKYFKNNFSSCDRVEPWRAKRCYNMHVNPKEVHVHHFFICFQAQALNKLQILSTWISHAAPVTKTSLTESFLLHCATECTEHLSMHVFGVDESQKLPFKEKKFKVECQSKNKR